MPPCPMHRIAGRQVLRGVRGRQGVHDGVLQGETRRNEA